MIFDIREQNIDCWQGCIVSNINSLTESYKLLVARIPPKWPNVSLSMTSWDSKTCLWHHWTIGHVYEIWTICESKITLVDLVIGLRVSGLNVYFSSDELRIRSCLIFLSVCLDISNGPWPVVVKSFFWFWLNWNLFKQTNLQSDKTCCVPADQHSSKTSDDLMSTCFAVMSLHNQESLLAVECRFW